MSMEEAVNHDVKSVHITWGVDAPPAIHISGHDGIFLEETEFDNYLKALHAARREVFGHRAGRSEACDCDNPDKFAGVCLSCSHRDDNLLAWSRTIEQRVKDVYEETFVATRRIDKRGL